MPRKLIIRYMLYVLFITFSMPLIFSPAVVFSENVFENAPGVTQIKVENNLLSVKLENAQLKEVLQEISRQTGLEFEGVENVEGRVTQNFENLPLDEGLKKISQSFIIILKKGGDKGAGLRIEKVIIIAHSGMADDALNSSQESKTSSSMISQKPGQEDKNKIVASATTSVPVSSPIPAPWQRNEASRPTVPPQARTQSGDQSGRSSGNQISLKNKKSGSIALAPNPTVTTPPPTPPVPPTPPRTPPPPITPPAQPVKPPVVSEPRAVSQPAIIPKQVEKTPSPEPEQVTPIPPVSPPSPDVSTQSLPLSSDSQDRKQGGKYFQEKRWDQAIKCFKRHLEKSPSDSEAKEMMETAKQNTDQAINLYQEAKKLEEAKQFESAHEYYKKSYAIYPLLYDTWERMRAIKAKINKK